MSQNLQTGSFIFRQLFEKTSSTYTYLIGCPETGVCALIDPVLETVDRDLQLVRELGLKLAYTVETHIHADHVTGALKLHALSDCQIAGAAMDNLPCRDVQLREGEAFAVGHVQIHPLFTPGHTDTHHAYLVDSPVHKMVFTGDCLLIDGCGRTDFQSGDAGVLYDSVHRKLYVLPDETLIYPGHDYENRLLTTIGQEKRRNPRLSAERERDSFIALMNSYDFPNPSKMDYAIPGNMQCGKCPDNLPKGMHRLCDVHDQG